MILFSSLVCNQGRKGDGGAVRAQAKPSNRSHTATRRRQQLKKSNSKPEGGGGDVIVFLSVEVEQIEHK